MATDERLKDEMTDALFEAILLLQTKRNAIVFRILLR